VAKAPPVYVCLVKQQPLGSIETEISKSTRRDPPHKRPRKEVILIRCGGEGSADVEGSLGKRCQVATKSKLIRKRKGTGGEGRRQDRYRTDPGRDVDYQNF